MALFADNVFILKTARKKGDLVAAAQSQGNKVYDLSRKWKLNLNADKSKCCSFSTWFNDSKWHPSLAIGGQLL